MIIEHIKNYQLSSKDEAKEKLMIFKIEVERNKNQET